VLAQPGRLANQAMLSTGAPDAPAWISQTAPNLGAKAAQWLTLGGFHGEGRDKI